MKRERKKAPQQKYDEKTTQQTSDIITQFVFTWKKMKEIGLILVSVFSVGFTVGVKYEETIQNNNMFDIKENLSTKYQTEKKQLEKENAQLREELIHSEHEKIIIERNNLNILKNGQNIK